VAVGCGVVVADGEGEMGIITAVAGCSFSPQPMSRVNRQRQRKNPFLEGTMKGISIFALFGRP
jgi:hypothetical protein